MNKERMVQKMRKELAEHFDKRNEYILDKIFEGNIIILGPGNLIKHLTDIENLKIEALKFEDKLTGYIDKNGKEFHTLYFAEKNEYMKKFLIKTSKRSDLDIDNYVGFSIYNDKNNKYGILSYDLDDGFDRSKVKNIIEYVLQPGVGYT